MNGPWAQSAWKALFCSKGKKCLGPRPKPSEGARSRPTKRAVPFSIYLFVYEKHSQNKPCLNLISFIKNINMLKTIKLTTHWLYRIKPWFCVPLYWAKCGNYMVNVIITCQLPPQLLQLQITRSSNGVGAGPRGAEEGGRSENRANQWLWSSLCQNQGEDQQDKIHDTVLVGSPSGEENISDGKLTIQTWEPSSKAMLEFVCLEKRKIFTWLELDAWWPVEIMSVF